MLELDFVVLRSGHWSQNFVFTVPPFGKCWFVLIRCRMKYFYETSNSHFSESWVPKSNGFRNNSLWKQMLKARSLLARSDTLPNFIFLYRYTIRNISSLLVMRIPFPSIVFSELGESSKALTACFPRKLLELLYLSPFWSFLSLPFQEWIPSELFHRQGGRRRNRAALCH